MGSGVAVQVDFPHPLATNLALALVLLSLGFFRRVAAHAHVVLGAKGVALWTPTTPALVFSK